MKKYIDSISPFIVMDILAKARQMPDAIHMEVGEPDLPPSDKWRKLVGLQYFSFLYT